MATEREVRASELEIPTLPEEEPDDDYELWLEKRGVGFPHYKLVKRKKESQTEREVVLVTALLFVLLMWAGVPMMVLFIGFVVVMALVALAS